MILEKRRKGVVPDLNAEPRVGGMQIVSARIWEVVQHLLIMTGKCVWVFLVLNLLLVQPRNDGGASLAVLRFVLFAWSSTKRAGTADNQQYCKRGVQKVCSVLFHLLRANNKISCARQLDCLVRSIDTLTK